MSDVVIECEARGIDTRTAGALKRLHDEMHASGTCRSVFRFCPKGL